MNETLSPDDQPSPSLRLADDASRNDAGSILEGAR